MNHFRFEAEITMDGAVPPKIVKERVYGGVTVSAAWPGDLDTPELRVVLGVRGDLDRRDAPAYAELYFHDVFLLLNLSSPGSFGGTVSTSGGELRVRDLSLDSTVFACAAPVDTPLADVVAWYDSLGIGTRQVATDGVATALFELLHLARGTEDEQVVLLRWARAAEALLPAEELPPRLIDFRAAVAHGRTPTFHPMCDDALDPNVDEVMAEWIEVADDAARLVLRALQYAIKSHRPTT